MALHYQIIFNIFNKFYTAFDTKHKTYVLIRNKKQYKYFFRHNDYLNKKWAQPVKIGPFISDVNPNKDP